MLIEIVFILGSTSAGVLLLHATGLRDWGVAPLGFIVGAAGYVAVGTAMLMMAVPRLPIATLAAMMMLAVGYWVRHVPDAAGRRQAGRYLGVTLPLLLLAVVSFRGLRLVNLHFDSLEHAAISSMLASGRLTYTDTAFVQFRGIGFAMLHSPAPLAGELYLASMGPLLALSILGAVVWFTAAAAHEYQGSRWPVTVGLLGAALLATNNRMVFHAFYLHAHTITAATMLILVAAGWLLALRTRPSLRPALYAMQIAVLPALVLARSEALVVAGLAIAPTLLSSKIARRHRIILAATYAVTLIAPQLFFIAEGFRVADGPHPNTVALLVLGVMAGGSAVVVARLNLSHRVEQGALAVGYASILGSAAALAFVTPEIMHPSLRALWGNTVLGGGGWGVSLIALATLLALALIIDRPPQRHHLVFPVITFVPAALLFALARGSSYRIDPADSLNRMLLHVLPLAILVMTATIVAVSARGTQAPDAHSVAPQNA